MIISKDRHHYPFHKFFPTIETFIDIVEKEYPILNTKSNEIKNRLNDIYNIGLNEEGKILFLRFRKWISKHFSFKFTSSLKVEFWLERGFDLEQAKSEIDSILNKRNELYVRKKEYKKRFEKTYSNIFYYGKNFIISDKELHCNICKNNLIVEKSQFNGEKAYKIISCSNEYCKNEYQNLPNRENLNLMFNWTCFFGEENAQKFLKRKKETILTKDYWIRKGYSDKEALNKVSEIQSGNSLKNDKPRIGKSKEYLKSKGYSEEQIKEICLSITSKEYWIKQGYTEENAIEKVRDHQSKASKARVYKSKDVTSHIDYYLNKGYSIEDANKLLKQRQSTFSKKICIEKYGEEKGIEVFNKRTKKWLDSFHKNGNISNGFSKISQDLFFELSKYFNDSKFALNGGELTIKKDGGGFWMYDFVYENKIIEYNGDLFHGNPNIYKSDDKPHPFKKDLTCEEIWQKDKIKETCAISNGYEYLVIWDSEYSSSKEDTINKCIEFLTKKIN